MEDLFPELNLQPGETHVAKGLRQLNAAQDLFETVAAGKQGFQGGTIGTVTTVANQEYTTYPAGLLSLEWLQLLDSSGRPIWDIEPAYKTGSSTPWPLSLFTSGGPGAPLKYWTNGTNIYWSPIPNAIYTIRYSGFASAADITAGGTFLYPDAAALPFATFAVRVLRSGTDDPTEDYISLAKDIFDPLVTALASFQKDSTGMPVYRYRHDT